MKYIFFSIYIQSEMYIKLECQFSSIENASNLCTSGNITDESTKELD
jgi:hypothetical protein